MLLNQDKQRTNSTKTIDIEDRWENSFLCTVIPDSRRSDGALIYRVVSPSKKIYRVILKGNTVRGCNCYYGSVHDPCACKHVLAAANYAVQEKGYQAIMPVANDFDWHTVKGCVKVFALAEGYKLLVGNLTEKEK